MVHEHFKMESLDAALDLVYQNSYFASVDLRKAYNSVVMSQNFRKYLRFEWRGILYQYCVLPNGLSSGPKLFTRIMRVLVSELRKSGFDNVFYLDDSLLIAPSAELCKSNISATIDILTKAGFDINHDKSVLTPTHRIQFLGFIIDSINMKVYLPDSKVERITHLCSNALSRSDHISINEIATLVGTMVSYMPAMIFGRLHLER